SRSRPTRRADAPGPDSSGSHGAVGIALTESRNPVDVHIRRSLDARCWREMAAMAGADSAKKRGEGIIGFLRTAHDYFINHQYTLRRQIGTIQLPYFRLRKRKHFLKLETKFHPAASKMTKGCQSYRPDEETR